MSELWKRNLPVPFFSQRENNYIWQRIADKDLKYKGKDYKKDEIVEEVSLAWASCNITSLCMILHYFGITDDTPHEMTQKFFEVVFPRFRQEPYPGYNVTDEQATGPDRLTRGENLKEFVHEAYNIPDNYIKHNEVKTLDEIKTKIASGYPVWISYGPLQDHDDRENPNIQGTGHIAVIRGFTSEGNIILNDPWGDPADATGKLKEADIDGIRGYYNFSIGSGDNAVLHVDDFNDIIRNPLNQSLVIEYPHIWSFPVRDIWELEKPLLFSSHGNAEMTDVEKRAYRLVQIAKMRRVEALDKACYPVTGSGRWHDGIHINKLGGTPVYSVGPGRLVVVKAVETVQSPDGTSSCFALVKHPLNSTDRGTEFYSLLMHLAPTNIAERLRQPFNFESFETTDWLYQIIQHIMPRRILIRPVNEGPSDGVMTEIMPKVYSSPNMNSETSESIGTREMIFLCPVDDGIRQRLFSIDESSLEETYNMLKSITNYKAGEGAFYCIFHRVNAGDSRTMWAKRYIRVGSLEENNLVLQEMNGHEFKYYRSKIAALMRGEVVVFNDDAPSVDTANCIDYHIEVNNQTIIGRVNNTCELHFGIFSDSCLIDDVVNGPYNGSDEKFFLVEDLEKAKYFNQHHIVRLMKEANYFIGDDFPWKFDSHNSLKNNVITEKTLKEVYKNKNNMFQTVVARHLNSYAKQDENEWIQMMKTEGSGIFEKNEQNIGDLLKYVLSLKWLSGEVISELNPAQKTFLDNPNGIFSTFYHPVRFLAWLDQKMNEGTAVYTPPVREQKQEKSLFSRVVEGVKQLVEGIKHFFNL